jgi:IPT/TIG domain-containing protein
MPAPIFGSAYMEVAPPVTPNPLNVNETTFLNKLDAPFVTAWNNAKYLRNDDWPGDIAFINFVAAIAYRYKSGTGVLTPALASISPTTIARNTAFTLTCTGTLFDALAKVEVTLAGATTILAPLTSTPTQITVSIPNNLLKTAGTATVLVRNLNGVASATQNLTVT